MKRRFKRTWVMPLVFVLALLGFGCDGGGGGGGGTPVPPDTTPPTAPTNVAAVPENAVQITITWTPSTDDVGVAGYKIYVGATTPVLIATVAGNVTSYVHIMLLPDTLYTYEIQAFDAAGNTATSTPASATTFIVDPTDAGPPSIPLSVVATAVGTDQIDLTWAASTDDKGVAGYLIYDDLANLLDTSTTTFFSESGLDPGTPYCYTVSALDINNNESGLSAQACATTDATPPPIVNYNASGIYTYTGGVVTLTITASDFPPGEVDVGIITMTVISITATTMTWDEGGTSVWTRLSGTPDDIVGAWVDIDGAETWGITFTSGGALSVTFTGPEFLPESNFDAWSQNWNGDYTIDFRYEEIRPATSVTVTGSGISGSAQLCNDGMGEWNSWVNDCGAQLDLGPTPLAPPLTYTFTVTDSTGTWTDAATVTCHMTEFATDLLPAGPVPGTPVFSWTAVSQGGVIYGVILMDDSWNDIWEVWDVSSSPVPYNGPPLTSGVYNYLVITEDPVGGCESNVWGTFTMP